MLAKNKYITRPTPLSDYYVNLLVNSEETKDTKDDKMDIEHEDKEANITPKEKEANTQNQAVESDTPYIFSDVKETTAKKQEEKNVEDFEKKDQAPIESNCPFNFNAAEDDDDESDEKSAKTPSKKNSNVEQLDHENSQLFKQASEHFILEKDDTQMNEEPIEDEIKPDQLQNLDDDKSTVISVVPSMLSG